jgi:hypothetical protein
MLREAAMDAITVILAVAVLAMAALLIAVLLRGRAGGASAVDEQALRQMLAETLAGEMASRGEGRDADLHVGPKGGDAQSHEAAAEPARISRSASGATARRRGASSRLGRVRGPACRRRRRRGYG